MRVWHLDTIGSPVSVDGVATGLWLLAAEQAKGGTEVTIYLRTPPDERASEIAARSGLVVQVMSRSVARLATSPPYRGLTHPPDLVHFHSGWIPFHPALAVALRQRKVPYVLTPHGSYSAVIRSSKPIPRAAYTRLVEAPYASRAGGAVFNLEAEGPDFRRLARHFSGRERTITFPIDLTAEVAPRAPGAEPTVVYLGRFEPFQKGLDRLAAIARRTPGVRFDLYGSEPEEGSSTLAALRREAPRNMRFHPPVYGAAKARVLASASLYVQPSRFDGFPLAVADAMLHRVPCAVADDLALATEVAGNDIGCVLPTDPVAGAAELSRLLGDPAQLQRWSWRGEEYVRRRFSAAASASNHLAFYEDVLSSRAPGPKRRRRRVSPDLGQRVATRLGRVRGRVVG